MKKESIFYLVTIIIFGSLMWFVLHHGKSLEANKMNVSIAAAQNVSSVVAPSNILTQLANNLHHPLAILILQMFCIVIVSRLFGFIMTKVGQPTVVGEILAGILLGPSLLGMLLPEVSAFIFPEESLRRLHVLSQIGLVFFMFIVGMELDLSTLKKKVQAAVVISHASIIFPYFLGMLLAYFLYENYAPANVHFSAFALFMGIAMSITAFPVLARIIQERNMMKTPLGTMIITCAAADDVTAWSLLAVVIAIVNAGSFINSLGTIFLSVLYVAFMLYVIKPFLNRFAEKYDTAESVSKMVVAVIFGILLLSSYLTEIIGIHALFGAFMAGTIIPAKKEFRQTLAEKIEDVSLVLFLPLFFVFTGLRTQIGLLNQPELWQVCGMVIGFAVIGKFVGSAVAAKFVGQSWRESLIIGALMNTRGLMELVVLNIGYDLGILSPEIFTIMVLMALITTFMTGPALNIIDYFLPDLSLKKDAALLHLGFNTLISFGRAKAGSRLLELAYFLNLKNEKDSTIAALHVSPSTEISINEAEQNEREAFKPIQSMAYQLGVKLDANFKVADNVQREIVKTARRGEYDLMLVGSSTQLFTDDQTGGKIREFISRLNCSVGVFVDKGFTKIQNCVIILDSLEDEFLLSYGRRFLEGNKDNVLTLLDKGKVFASLEQAKIFAELKLEDRILKVEAPDDRAKFYSRYDLVIISFTYWKKIRENNQAWIADTPSILIVSK